jgi:predicted  nucleic acid-binding Zn-ribbon protein
MQRRREHMQQAKDQAEHKQYAAELDKAKQDYEDEKKKMHALLESVKDLLADPLDTCDDETSPPK